MNKFTIALLAFISLCLTGCSPIKNTIKNQYQLGSYSQKRLVKKPSRVTLLVTVPESVATYQTEQMLYIKKPYEINAFAHNAWVDPPADMLFPLMVQSLQQSGYFYAVASSATSEQTDYRLDTQLMELQQNFLRKPSVLHLVVKNVLTSNHDNRVIASKVIKLEMPCTSETPYGGVLAANRATLSWTEQLTSFVVNQIQKDRHQQQATL